MEKWASFMKPSLSPSLLVFQKNHLIQSSWILPGPEWKKRPQGRARSQADLLSFAGLLLVDPFHPLAGLSLCLTGWTFQNVVFPESVGLCGWDFAGAHLKGTCC